MNVTTGIVSIPHLPFLGFGQSLSGGCMAVPVLERVLMGSRVEVLADAVGS